jgi:hypothetical protein
VLGGVVFFAKKGHLPSAGVGIHEEKQASKPVLSDDAGFDGTEGHQAASSIKGMKTVDEELDARVERIREEVEQGVRKPASRTAATPPKAREICRSSEFPGLGTEFSKITPKAWARVLDEYHEAKAITLAWIAEERMSGNLEIELAEWMDSQTRDIRIQRPPTAEEPDLSWRGVVAMSEDVKGDPLIRVGGGFLTLMDKDPRRARFELVRTISQTWSGCRLAQAKLKAPWKDYLSCMGVPASSCKAGSLGEDSWAVSTRVATQIASPGCRIPAFEEASASKCYSRFPASVVTARIETETHSGD